jgi:hypothetical protein
MSQESSSRGGGKGFSVPFLCLSKLEVKFFQCVAVQPNSGA